MNVQAGNPPDRFDLTAGDLLVTCDEFVRRAAKAVGIADISPVDVQALAQAIRDGMSRFDVIDILAARANPADPRLSRPKPDFLAGNFNAFVVVDLVERYSPEDDREFARFAMEKI